ncbi:unnamed protein product [marine sediment metagenome]|uniref:Uncharacterized protein n=1 Tax=marine sediment metagenome TaxID=412755 RepID=X0Z6U3_9ZZZZ
MDEESKQEILKVLKKELSKQQGIFNKHAPIAINPNAKGYDEALTAFNKADWAIKDIQKQIAYLLTEETYEPSVIDKIVEVFDKLTGDDDPGTSSTTGVRG